MCILSHLALGIEDGGVQLVTALVAWHGGLFLTEGKIGVLSVSFLFLTRVGVYVGACVCIRAHPHTLHRWGTRCEPRSQDKTMTPGRPEETRWTKYRHTHIRALVKQEYELQRASLHAWSPCNGAEASLPLKLLQTYLESCTSIVQSVFSRPPSSWLDEISRLTLFFQKIRPNPRQLMTQLPLQCCTSII